MTKFKIGNKVRIIGNTNDSANKIGDIGVILEGYTHTNNKNTYRVDCGNGRYDIWTMENEMELIITEINKNIKVL